MNLRLPTAHDVFLPLLAEAWDNDIITVVSAGNYRDEPQGDWSPQRHSNERNGLINAVAIQQDGRLWTENCPVGPSPVSQDAFLTGRNDAAFIAVNIACVEVDQTHRNYVGCSGTSWAAASIAGLMAYWISLPAPYTLPGGAPGTIAFRAKQAIAGLARGPQWGSPDAIGHAYNNVKVIADTCGINLNPPRSLERSTEPSVNETAEMLWAEIERIYWESIELEKKTSKLGSEAVLLGPKDKAV